MKTLTTKNIMIALIAILVITALFFYIRYKKLKSETETPNNVPMVEQSAIYGAGSSSGSTPVVPIVSYHGSDISKWKKGDLLIAKSLVNIYSSVLISSSNIVATRNAGETIGVVDEIVGGGFVKVKWLSVNWLMWASGNEGYIFPLGNNVTN